MNTVPRRPCRPGGRSTPSRLLSGGIALATIALCLLVMAAMATANGQLPDPAQAPGASPASEAGGITWQDAVKMFAAALTIGLTAFATAITQCRIGSAGVGALAENPKRIGIVLVFLVIPETMVILGFVIAALILF